MLTLGYKFLPFGEAFALVFVTDTVDEPRCVSAECVLLMKSYWKTCNVCSHTCCIARVIGHAFRVSLFLSQFLTNSKLCHQRTTVVSYRQQCAMHDSRTIMVTKESICKLF